MKFEWDELKNSSNLQKHGLDFATASLVLMILLPYQSKTVSRITRNVGKH